MLILTYQAANHSGANTTYTTMSNTLQASNAFAGDSIVISGFTNSANNGTFTCSASTATTLVVNNGSGVLETNYLGLSTVAAVSGLPSNIYGLNADQSFPLRLSPPVFACVADVAWWAMVGPNASPRDTVFQAARIPSTWTTDPNGFVGDETSPTRYPVGTVCAAMLGDTMKNTIFLAAFFVPLADKSAHGFMAGYVGQLFPRGQNSLGSGAGQKFPY